jgi:FkbM family methyltransferase
MTRSITPFPIDANYDDTALLDYWSTAQSNFNPNIFTGHLRLLQTPYVGHLSYNRSNCDLRFKFFINTEVGHQWYASPDTVFAEFDFYNNIGLIAKGDVIFDCGAHQGMYSILFSKITGESGAVFSFELVPFNAWLTRFNQDLNGIANVQVLPIGLSDKDAVIKASPQAHSMQPSVSGDSEQMLLRKLDNFLALKPTVVKMDIEGAEIHALRGATHLLNTRIKWAISVHPPFIQAFGEDPNTIIEYFPSDTFKCLIKYPGLDVTEYHGQFPLEDFCELAFLPRV